MVTPRSLLFAPGDDAHKLTKAMASGCALVVADLEDAVAEPAKERARATVAEVLGARDRAGAAARCAVRVNGLDTAHAAPDLAMVATLGVDAVVVPKATADGVARLAGRGLPPVIAIVETAAGLQQSDRIARAPGVWALLLGGVDLGQDLRWTPRADGLELLFARSKLVMDSAAAGIAAPIDVVHPDVRALDALRAESAFAKSLGFGGKACIHPGQLAVVHDVFAPSAAELDRAARIITRFELALADGLGVVEIDGEMVDRPVYERALDIVNDGGNAA